MMTTERVIKILKKVGECIRDEEELEGSCENLTRYTNSNEFSHLIAFLQGIEYDSSLRDLEDTKVALHEIETKLNKAIKAEKKHSYIQTLEKEIQGKQEIIAKLEAHIEEVNNKILDSIEDKSKIYKVIYASFLEDSNLELLPGRLVQIDRIDIEKSEITLYNVKCLNFLEVIGENEVKKDVVSNIETIDEFNEYFEKVV